MSKFPLVQNLSYATTYFFVFFGNASIHEPEKRDHDSTLKSLAWILGSNTQRIS